MALVALVLFGGLFLAACQATATANSPRPPAVAAKGYRAFSNPEPVTIEGYSGDAMEPFVSPDGQYLLFNTSNQAPVTTLQYATRVNDQTFDYQGPVQGVNLAQGLSAVPTLDRSGRFYFVSTRSYSQTLSTIYAGQFQSGSVTGVALTAGVSADTAGIVEFDVDVSPDGKTLYIAVGHFTGGSNPSSANLAIFDKTATGFSADPNSTRILAAVNATNTLTYAADISANGRELFFTQVNLAGGPPAIYRATRAAVRRPFGHVQRVTAITGFAEAPSLSPDGKILYYHEKVGTVFRIYDVTRR